MKKKEIAICLLKLVLELAVLVLLILIIIHLINAKDGVLSKIEEGTALEKLQVAVKIFNSTPNMKLEEAINRIEGLEELEYHQETGEYFIKIDGQDFLVLNKEITAENEP